MPVTINDTSVLVPAPLVTFDKQFLRAANGEKLGVSYTVTLNGTILPNRGNPVVNSSTLVSSFSTDGWTTSESPDDDTLHGVNDTSDYLQSIMAKQEEIRKVFSAEQAVKVEITDWGGNSQGIKFVGQVQNISFPNEGRWVQPCPYTITMTTHTFLESVDSGDFSDNSTEDGFTWAISNANESWSIEETEDKIYLLDNTYSADNQQATLKLYRISHTVSANGLPVYTSQTGDYLSDSKPWEQAKGWVTDKLGPGYTPPTGLLNVVGAGYTLADRAITESIDVQGGNYSATETYTAWPSGAFHPYPAVLRTEVQINRDEAGTTKVDINGVIRGLNTAEPTGVATSGINSATYPATASGTENLRVASNALQNARAFYADLVSNDRIYHGARQGSEVVWLHPKPLTYSEGINPNAGSIQFNYSYDDRPPNLVAGSVSESIDVQDTYPGQVIASIPVIGRSQPILQYLNSRTEYRRRLSISVNMGPIAASGSWLANTGNILVQSGYWSAATSDNLQTWFNRKPGITATGDLTKIYEAFNPANEAGVNPSSVYYTPPEESWNPRTGQYSYAISWTYTK